MLRYFVRRILLAFPTLLIISLITFGLSKCAPKDRDLEIDGTASSNKRTTYKQEQANILLKAAKYGLDKPSFYFTISTAALPDTIYKVFPISRCEHLTRLAAESGNWDAVNQYDRAVHTAWDLTSGLPDSIPGVTYLRLWVSTLLTSNRPDSIGPLLDRTQQASANIPALSTQIDVVRNCRHALLTQKHPENNWIPVLHWYGLDNQYHNWLSGFVTGNLGITRSMQKQVWSEIRPALMSTLLLNGLGVLLAYLVGVPLGVMLARREHTATDRWIRRLLLFFYAMPVFWLGALLILFFATPGSGLYIIPGVAISPLQDSGKTLLEWFLSDPAKFILPVFTISVHILAVLALQMRGSVISVMHQDFIRTARAKGVSENGVYWRHAYRNALFPIVSIFAGVFPVIFAGSLVVENMFYYPGMGVKTFQAFHNYDYPLLFALLMIASTFTILGSMISDLLFAWLDPRVKYA
jgi:peptide/nickel transport system permease protein